MHVIQGSKYILTIVNKLVPWIMIWYDMKVKEISVGRLVRSPSRGNILGWVFSIDKCTNLLVSQYAYEIWNCYDIKCI